MNKHLKILYPSVGIFYLKIMFKCLFPLVTLLLFIGCSRGLRHSISPDVNLPVSEISLNKPPLLIWTEKLPSPPNQLLSVNEESILIASHRGELFIIDIKTGKRTGRIWQPYNRPINLLKLEREEGLLYFSSPGEEGVYDYDLIKAKKIWKTLLPGIYGNMATIGDTLFVFKQGGAILTIDRKSGKIMKERTLSTRISWGVYRYQDLLWIYSEDGLLCSYDKTLKHKETFRISNNPNPVISVIGKKLVIGDSDGRITCFDLDKKRILFTKQLSAPIYSEPFITNSHLIVAQSNGIVTALDPVKGTSIWQYQGGGLVNQPLLGTSHQVIVPFTRGTIVALDLDSGKEQWRYDLEHRLRQILIVIDGIIVTEGKNIIHYLKSDT